MNETIPVELTEKELFAMQTLIEQHEEYCAGWSKGPEDEWVGLTEQDYLNLREKFF